MAPSLVGRDQDTVWRCRSLDWPLSREEKKGRVMQLYEDEVRAVELLLESQEQALEEALEANIAAREAVGQEGKAVSSRGLRRHSHHAGSGSDVAVSIKSAWTPTVAGLGDATSCLGGLSAPSTPPAAAEAPAPCDTLLSVPLPRYGDLRRLIRYGDGGKKASLTMRKSLAQETFGDPHLHSAAAGEIDEASALAAGNAHGGLRWWPAGETCGLAPCGGGAADGGLGRQGQQSSPRVTFSSGVEGTLTSNQTDRCLNHESFPQITWKPSLARTLTPRTLPTPCRSRQPVGS